MGATRGGVRCWDDEPGLGVVDSADTSGGCWVHWSVVDVDGFRRLVAGQGVWLEWESGWQDGYDYRATRVTPGS
ncbi:MAG: cold shock domain-containing protein [Streptomycetales bacterium]